MRTQCAPIRRNQRNGMRNLTSQSLEKYLPQRTSKSTEIPPHLSAIFQQKGHFFAKNRHNLPLSARKFTFYPPIGTRKEVLRAIARRICSYGRPHPLRCKYHKRNRSPPLGHGSIPQHTHSQINRKLASEASGIRSPATRGESVIAQGGAASAA